MAAPAKPTKPVKRYDVDGNQLKTGHTIGSRAQHIPVQGDDRVQALRAYQAEQETLADHEKDLAAPAVEAFDATAAAVGITHPLAEAGGALDAAIMQSNAAAGARNADAKLTPAQVQAKATATALADVLAERGIVPEPPRPMVAGDEYDQPLEDDEAFDQGKTGWLEDDGSFIRDDGGDTVMPAGYDDDEPEDQWPNYTSGDAEGFYDLTAAGDDETETELEEAS
jgi:hypothetical protein